jgi:hypothetical protein
LRWKISRSRTPIARQSSRLEKSGRDQGGGFDPYNQRGSGKREGDAARRQGITGSRERDRSAALDRLYGKKKP